MQWEYKTIEIPQSNKELFEETLNKWGELGWEVIKINPTRELVEVLMKKQKGEVLYG